MTTINPIAVSNFIKANLKEANRIVFDLIKAKDGYDKVKSEEKRAGDIVLSQNEYFDEDDKTRITENKYAWCMDMHSFEEFLVKRVAILVESDVMKKYYPEINLSMHDITFNWKYHEPLIKLDRELINFMKPVLGFGDSDVVDIDVRRELIENLVGLIKTHPSNTRFCKKVDKFLEV